MDEADTSADPQRFTQSESNLEVGPGPNATLWHPGEEVRGTYRLSADITHLDSGEHPHGAGLVFGGSNIDSEDQVYTYFLVRCDGDFLIRKREGEVTDEVLPWTPHLAVATEDDQGITHNRLTVEVTGKETRFLVNDKQVHVAPSAELYTDGRYGVRLVHDIHVRFGKLLLEPVGQ